MLMELGFGVSLSLNLRYEDVRDCPVFEVVIAGSVLLCKGGKGSRYGW